MNKAVTLVSINMDPVTKAPFIILRDIEGNETLPLWIGFLEARAIASEIRGRKFPRPQTHDLLKNIMDQTESKVTKVEIYDLRDNTYYALIHLTNRGESLTIDSRPSDAIALAIRAQAPIFVSDEVLRKSRQIEGTEGNATGDKSEQRKNWRDMLEKLQPEDFSKYKVESYSFTVRP